MGTQTGFRRRKSSGGRKLTDWPRLVRRSTKEVQCTALLPFNRVRASDSHQSSFGVWETEGSNKEISLDFLYTSLDLRRNRKGTPKKISGNASQKSPISVSLVRTERAVRLLPEGRKVGGRAVPELGKRVEFQTLRERLRRRVLKNVFVPDTFSC